MPNGDGSEPEIKKGLAGVYVDTTAVSKVMPETNSLTYRGYAVQDLAKECRFEEVAYLLWNGELPTKERLVAFETEERSQREISDDHIEVIRRFPTDAHPMDTVRTAVSYLGTEDSSWGEDSEADQRLRAMKLFSKIPTMIATDYRVRKGQDRIGPDTGLGFSENFFNMCFGEVPAPEIIEAFDVSMTLYAEHSFNASTFAARVVASTLSDIYSAVAAGIGALKGPLHGGANEAVMHMLIEIGDPAKAQAWIDQAIAEKRRIMGFGHRVYRQGDSRVPTMRACTERLSQWKDETKWLEISNVLEATMVKEKGIHPNLDFPAGPAYYLMGFDIDMFTPLFVIARITGWTAHIIEQLAANSLIRPLSAYGGVAQRPVPVLDDR